MRLISWAGGLLERLADPRGGARRGELYFSFLNAFRLSPEWEVELHRGRLRMSSESASLFVERLRRPRARRELRFYRKHLPRLLEVGGGSLRTIEIADGAIECFWRVAAEVGAWEWRGDLGPFHMCDGPTWSLEMRRDGRAMKCTGHDLAGPPEGLPRFLRALGVLIGRPAFDGSVDG